MTSAVVRQIKLISLRGVFSVKFCHGVTNHVLQLNNETMSRERQRWNFIPLIHLHWKHIKMKSLNGQYELNEQEG